MFLGWSFERFSHDTRNFNVKPKHQLRILRAKKTFLQLIFLLFLL